MPNGKMTPAQTQAAWEEEAKGFDMDQEVRRHLPLYGAISFDELENANADEIMDTMLNRLNIYFMLILGNIVSNPDIAFDEIGIRLHETVADYARKLNRLNNGIAPANADDANTIIPKKQPLMKDAEKEIGRAPFSLWKDRNTGQYRWLAIYSNNFMDRDDPPEIISEKSHKTFVQLVDEGVVDYPELWHWHLPGTAWGKADMLDYVDGFAVAVGYVYPGHEKEAVALSRRKDLGVSHGMPFSTLLYDAENPHVIDFHVTREISVLPHHAVANPLTDFVVLGKPGEKSMPIASKKRDWLRNDVGLSDGDIEGLERNLKELDRLAKATGMNWKSMAEDSDESDEESYEDEELDAGDEEYDEGDVEYDEDESDEDQEEDDSQEKARSSRRPRARKGYLWTGGAKGTRKGRPQSGSTGPRTRDEPSSFAPRGRDDPKTRDEGRPQGGSVGSARKKPSSFAPRKRVAKKKEFEAPVVEELVTKDELLDVLEKVVGPIYEQFEAINGVLEKSLNALKELSDARAEQEELVKEQTPTLSLAERLQSRIPIGQKAAQADGRTLLGKDGPQETQPERAAFTPVPMINNLMHATMGGNPAQKAQ